LSISLLRVEVVPQEIEAAVEAQADSAQEQDFL